MHWLRLRWNYASIPRLAGSYDLAPKSSQRHSFPYPLSRRRSPDPWMEYFSVPLFLLCISRHFYLELDSWLHLYCPQ
jgi:hypothetical protein